MLRPFAAGWVLAIAGLVAGCGQGRALQSGMAAQFPSPMAENTREHRRLDPPAGAEGLLLANGPLQGEVIVYPPNTNGTARPARFGAEANLLLHFHGPGYLALLAARDAETPTIAASVNLGSGSSAYGRPFADRAVFPALLDSIRARVGATRKGRIYLSGFSAGYGAVRAILRNYSELIDGVLLLDGLHASYVPEGRTLYEGGHIDSLDVKPFLDYARQSVSGEKRFLFTHSEIFPGTYASTTETADFLLNRLGVREQPVLEWGPGGMQMVSRAHEGRFTVLGFAGNTAPDHIDHVHGLPVFLKMLLNE